MSINIISFYALYIVLNYINIAEQCNVNKKVVTRTKLVGGLLFEQSLFSLQLKFETVYNNWTWVMMSNSEDHLQKLSGMD